MGYCAQSKSNRNTEKPKKQNHQNRKKDKKNLLAFWQATPIFANFLFLSSYTLSCLQSCVLLKNYKNSVLSRTQLVGITDSKTPFRAPSQNGTFATKSVILGFPVCLLEPLCLECFVTWNGHKKRTIFQKQIVATKMRFFTV